MKDIDSSELRWEKGRPFVEGAGGRAAIDGGDVDNREMNGAGVKAEATAALEVVLTNDMSASEVMVLMSLGICMPTILSSLRIIAA
jgi:hypothetical protein